MLVKLLRRVVGKLATSVSVNNWMDRLERVLARVGLSAEDWLLEKVAKRALDLQEDMPISMMI